MLQVIKFLKTIFLASWIYDNILGFIILIVHLLLLERG